MSEPLSLLRPRMIRDPAGPTPKPDTPGLRLRLRTKRRDPRAPAKRGRLTAFEHEGRRWPTRDGPSRPPITMMTCRMLLSTSGALASC